MNSDMLTRITRYYRALNRLRAIGLEKVFAHNLADAAGDILIIRKFRRQESFRRDLAVHERKDPPHGAEVIFAGNEQFRLQNDIFVFHYIILILFDRVELPRTDEDDVSGCDRTFFQVGGHDAPPLLDHDHLQLRVPVQGHGRKVPGDGAQIGVIGKICGRMRFSFVVVLVFTEIHHDSIVQ